MGRVDRRDPRCQPLPRAKVESGRHFAEAGLTEGVSISSGRPPIADPGDPETQRHCMPALGPPVRDWVASDFPAMDGWEFRRAFLDAVGVTLMAKPVIPLEAWNRCYRTPDRPLKIPSPWLSTSRPTALELPSAWLVVDLTAAGTSKLSTIDPAPSGSPMVEDLIAKHHPSGIFCDAGGPAGSLLKNWSATGSRSPPCQPESMAKRADLLRRRHGRQPGSPRQPELTAALGGAVNGRSETPGPGPGSPRASTSLLWWLAPLRSGCREGSGRTQGIWSISEEIEKLRAKQQANGEPVSDVDPMNSSAPPVIPTGGGQGFISFKEFYR